MESFVYLPCFLLRKGSWSLVDVSLTWLIRGISAGLSWRLLASALVLVTAAISGIVSPASSTRFPISQQVSRVDPVRPLWPATVAARRKEYPYHTSLCWQSPTLTVYATHDVNVGASWSGFLTRAFLWANPFSDSDLSNPLWTSKFIKSLIWAIRKWIIRLMILRVCLDKGSRKLITVHSGFRSGWCIFPRNSAFGLELLATFVLISRASKCLKEALFLPASI